MNKLAIAVFGALISTQSLASGIYVGAQLGMGNTTVDATASNIKQNFGNSDPVYSAFIGFEANSDQRMFMAVEVDGVFGESKGGVRVVNLTGEMARKNVYGLHILAGIPMSNNAAIYFRVGGVKGKFSAQESNGSTTETYSKTENGMVLGLGSRFALDDQINLRLDYRYTKFSTFKFAETGADMDVRDQYFTAGLQYMF